MRTLTLFFLLATLLACKPRVPREYIQPDDMEDLLYDYYIGKAMASRSDEVGYNQRAYRLAVLKKHGVTEAQFDSSLVYYYGDAERLKKIYDAVASRLEGVATGLGASAGEMNKYATLGASGDTADIWNGPRRTLLLPVAPYNRLSFRLDADSTYRRGDQFQLNLNAQFLYQAGTKDGLVYVAVDYEGDSTSVHYTRVSSTGECTLMVPRNTEAAVKSIRGFVYLGNGATQSPLQKLLFIDGIQLIRFHAKPEDLQAAEEAKQRQAREEARLDSMRRAGGQGGATPNTVINDETTLRSPQRPGRVPMLQAGRGGN